MGEGGEKVVTQGRVEEDEPEEAEVAGVGLKVAGKGRAGVLGGY